MAAAPLSSHFLRSPPPNPFFSPHSTTNTTSAARHHRRRTHTICRSGKKISASVSHVSKGFPFFLPELHLDDKEAEALLQGHPELELEPPEALRNCVLSLQSLGITGFALQRTVLRRPEILTSAAFKEFLRFAERELRDAKPSKLERILETTPPDALPRIAKGVQLLMRHGVPHDKIGHLLNNVNVRKVFVERPQRELREMIEFFQEYCWPELILRRPALLNLDLHSQLIPRVDFFVELVGGDREAAAALVRKLPALLSYTVEHYHSRMEFWRSSVGLDEREVFRIAMVYPNIFSVGMGKLKPRIEFLKECNLDTEDIFKFLIKAPLFTSLSFEENLSKKLAFLVKIGYEHRTRELALALGATTRTSCYNMQMVLGLFFGHGLSAEDVFAMSKKHPPVLQYNHQSLAEKMEFLIDGMDRGVEEILAFPAFLGYKLDDRIKKRYEMMKCSSGKDMSLNKLLSVSTEKFQKIKG